ncbi:hypothetical protein ABT061_09305 [Streptosporangium sp. NPDC002544]|uniref:hypothetical protein n=1 Tax=Streptosporangium sp. NPDC002544 TaxID=3154538 RepID=UPI0033261E75
MTTRRRIGGHAAIPEIRRQLERYDLDSEWVGEVRSLSDLRAATEHACRLRILKPSAFGTP